MVKVVSYTYPVCSQYNNGAVSNPTRIVRMKLASDIKPWVWTLPILLYLCKKNHQRGFDRWRTIDLCNTVDYIVADSCSTGVEITHNLGVAPFLLFMTTIRSKLLYGFSGNAVLQRVVLPDCLGPVRVITGYCAALSRRVDMRWRAIILCNFIVVP